MAIYVHKLRDYDRSGACNLLMPLKLYSSIRADISGGFPEGEIIEVTADEYDPELVCWRLQADGGLIDFIPARFPKSVSEPLLFTTVWCDPDAYPVARQIVNRLLALGCRYHSLPHFFFTRRSKTRRTGQSWWRKQRPVFRGWFRVLCRRRP